MNIIHPLVYVYMDKPGKEMLMNLERWGRVCYKSEHNICPGSAIAFIKMLMSKKHFAMLEHEKITVRVICNRGVTHEIVRHRIASYSQESTRYCNYSPEMGHLGDMTFIYPTFWDPDNSEDDNKKYNIWYAAMLNASEAYNALIHLGCKPQEARDVLPNALKTEIVITMNLREWRHFFYLRTAKAAHPQMQEVANMLLAEFRERVPIIFDTLASEE